MTLAGDHLTHRRLRARRPHLQDGGMVAGALSAGQTRISASGESAASVG